MTLPPLTIIPAGAGSGKTYTIKERLAAWVAGTADAPPLVAPERIVAVTFTEAAAAELRERIRAELVQRGRLEDALRLEQAYISTIHGFGLRLLTEFAFEAGISPSPRLLSEDEEDILIRQALVGTERADAIMGDLGRFGYRYDFNSGKGAEDAFRSAVLHLIGKLRSIGRLQEDERLAAHAGAQIEALYGPTQTADHLKAALHRAVCELLEHFPGDLSGLYPGNASATKALRENFRDLKRASGGEALDGDWKLWQSLRELRQSKRGTALPEGYDELAGAVMAAAAELPGHPGPLAEALAHVQALLGASQDSLERYAGKKREKGLVDYTDMLAIAHQLLLADPQVLATLKDRVDCLVIDEFQDTNPLQFALLWALREAGVPTLVVGDLKQAIMGFQNADSRLLQQLQAQFPEATSPLTSNWRSQPALMGWVNAVGAGLFGARYTPLEPKADYPSHLSPLEVIAFAERGKVETRAQHTAARVKALLDDPGQVVFDRHGGQSRPLRGGDIAIICPTNGRLGQYAAALRALGVRSQMEQGGWFDSPVIQIAYHALCCVADPGDRHAALYLAATELGEQSLESALATLLDGACLEDGVLAALAPLREGHSGRTAEDWVAEVIAALDLYGVVAEWPDASQARANLLRLQGEAAEFLRANREALASGGFYGTGLKTFLAWLRRRAEREDGQPTPRVRDEEAVRLTTWHKSKGKEWPVVVVASADGEVKAPLPSFDVSYRDFSDLGAVLEEARIEISPDFVAPETKEDFQEPLREKATVEALNLLYVALTRAREKLILEWHGYLDKPGSRKSLTYWEVLKAAAELELSGTAMTASGQFFDCRVVETSKEAPPEFDSPPAEAAGSLPVIGRRAFSPRPLPGGLTTEALTPSGLEGEPVSEGGALEVSGYGPPLEIDLGLEGAERGNLLHRCFEIMDGTRDREMVSRALGCALTAEQYTALGEAVASFEGWLAAELSPLSLEREVPILTLDKAGSVVTGFIDLLVETEQGYWIVDHKSDQIEDREERFAYYLPQLRCYAEAVRRIFPDKPVLGVAINWISYGCVMCQAVR